MKNELTCPVVRDLLPSFVEGLTAPETNDAVERHLADCPACAALRADMAAPETETAAPEVDYLKTIKRRSGRRVALAVVCTALLLAAGFALKIFVIGTPLQAQMWAVSAQEKNGALELHLSTVSSGTAYHSWEVENQDGVVSIYARQVLASPLFSDGSKQLTIPLEGVDEIWLGGPAQQLIWQSGVPITYQTADIYALRTPYVGDAPAVGRLLGEIDLWYGPIGGYTLSLQTAAPPYGMTVDVTAPDGRADVLMAERYSAMLLALVENLDQVAWRFTQPDGTVESRSYTAGELTETLRRRAELAGQADGLRSSIKDCAASAAAFQQLTNLLME